MKVIGYILVLLGIAFASASKVVALQNIFISSLKLSKSFLVSYSLLIGGAIVLVGVFILIKSGHSHQDEEVPIYEGKKIVGYRRS